MHHAFLHISLLSLHDYNVNAYFHVLSRTGTQDNNFLFLFLNFDTVLWNPTPKTFANVWRIKRDGISAIKFEAAQIHFLRACLHEGGGPQVGDVTCGGSPHLTCKRDHIKMRDYMDRRVTLPKRVTSPTWGPPASCKQALSVVFVAVAVVVA